MNLKRIIAQIIALLLTFLFVYTAASKLGDYNQFVEQMNSQPFNNSYTPLLVWGVPLAELLTSLLLMFSRSRLLGFYSSTALMALFTGYIILIQLNYYSYIPCSCGGVIRNLTWTQHLIFNIFFLILGIMGIVTEKKLNKQNLNPVSLT